MQGVLVGQRRHRHVGRAALGRHRVRDGAPQDRRRRRRPARRVGLPRRRHGRGDAARCATRPSRSARRCAPTRRVAAHRRARRRGARRRARNRARSSAPTSSIAATHPKITFLEQHRPRRAARRLRRPTSSAGRRRSGTVKVNVARRPAARVHRASPASTPRCTAARSCSPSRSTTSRARSRTRSRAGRPRLPFADICIPSVFDPHARARGQARRCRCSRSGCRTSGRREPHARRARRVRRPGRSTQVDAVAPGFTRFDPAPPGDRARTRWSTSTGSIGGNIFHGELSPDQLFHMRPAPGLRRLPHADRRPLPGELARPTAAAA